MEEMTPCQNLVLVVRYSIPIALFLGTLIQSIILKKKLICKFLYFVNSLSTVSRNFPTFTKWGTTFLGSYGCTNQHFTMSRDILCM